VIQFNKEIDEMIARLKDIVGEFRIPAAMAAKSDPLLSGLGLSDEDIARYI